MRSIIVDTGPLVALFHARDEHHEAAKAVLESNPSLLVSTWPVITEACHFLRRDGRRALFTYVQRGALRIEALSVDDLPGLNDLLERYDRMDFADATLVLIAERTGITEIFTVDRRDFEGYRTRSGRRLRLLLA
ncbi:MAG: type II toxin-antitoxin system VapC family toxin [Burkholderiales bacterium]